MAGSNRKAAVELVEGAELDLDEPFAPAEELPKRSWRDVVRRGWPLALVAVVVAGAFTVAQARESSRVDARLEAMRPQFGYIEGLGPEMGVLWSVDLAPREYFGGSTEELMFVSHEDGGLRVIDLASGDERWHVAAEPDRMTYCWGSDEPAGGTTHVLCERYGYSSLEEPVDFEDREIERRDAMTGEVIEVRDPNGQLSLEWWGPDVLVLAEVDGALELRREAFDGEARWRVPVTGTADGTAAAWVDPVADVAVVRTDRHLVVDGDGQVVLDVPVREDVAAAAAAGLVNEWLSPQRGGSFVLSRYVDDVESVEVYDSQGERSFSTVGYVATPMVDDQVVPGLVVVHPPWGLAVWDSTTGKAAVELDGAPNDGTMLLHGALIYQREGELRAVDVRTGEERWHAQLEQSELLGSDGDVVLFLSYEGDPELFAFSARTGALVWTYPLPSASAFPMVYAGALMLQDGQTLVRLGTGQ
ncbi:MAG: PQQ-binding-like beta-propeller repeat protein [Actinomycetales bacterium]|nr:PQQ-binding-like beta-propeller repeat protein [Actinomycetales bacterium]